MAMKGASESINDDKRINVVDLDRILVNELGQFGCFQLRTLVLLAVAMLFSGWQAEYIFTAARIPTRCVIPECDNSSMPLEFAPYWILNAVPGTGPTDIRNCQRFANSKSLYELYNLTI